MVLERFAALADNPDTALENIRVLVDPCRSACEIQAKTSDCCYEGRLYYLGNRLVFVLVVLSIGNAEGYCGVHVGTRTYFGSSCGGSRFASDDFR
jgi:hypothetical protein